MARLIYVTRTSLDGFIADETGDFDWAVPDEEVHAFINDVIRPAGTHLYGRKMYQTMRVWETPEVIPGPTPAIRDFARIWNSVPVVYSSPGERRHYIAAEHLATHEAKPGLFMILISKATALVWEAQRTGTGKLGQLVPKKLEEQKRSVFSHNYSIFIEAHITEYWCERAVCPDCGKVTLAGLPDEVRGGGADPN